MNTEKLVNEKISRIALKNQKVDLGIVDDIKRVTNALNSQISIDDRVMKESVKLFGDLVNAIPKAKEIIKTNKSIVKSTDSKINLAENALKEAKKAADELGVNPKSINGYNDLEQLIDEVKKSQSRVDEIADRLQRLF